ncbi:hypothetical protein JT359_01725 [Candidatus Poribacteria bacterium]|nr:hypothetical protein [Candidatus Poribacteria bacterium]
MNNIRVDIRLRPIRFGFLVRPDDAKNILEIFRINTCLWGGMFNPIIPIFDSVPSWLEDEGFRFDNPIQMINDYLDFFEPDFLVEAEEGLAEGFGFDPKRTVSLDKMLEEPEGRYAHKYGLSVHGLYTDLYAKEFQFEQRHKTPFVDIQLNDTDLTNFAACLFGSFPTQERLKHFAHNYSVIFNPKPVVLNGDTLTTLYQSGYSSALNITFQEIEVRFNAPLLPTLCILDAHNSEDIVDFWNLRAIHQLIFPIPIQWIEELSPFCKKFIQDNYRRQPDDASGRMVGPVLMFSRSLSEKNIEYLVENFSFIDENDVYTVQRWSPTIWYKLSEQVASPTRPTIVADRKVMNLPFDGDNPEIRLDPLFPDFIREYNLYRVANVVKLQDWSDEEFVVRARDRIINDQIASTLPIDYKQPTILKFLPDFLQNQQFILPTTEGLVFYPYRENIEELWNLVDGTTAFNQWFNENKIPAIRSDAGRTTKQIIDIIGSLNDIRFIAHKDIIEFLNKMAGRINKSSDYCEFKNKIGKAIKKENPKDITFETLINKKVVELGQNLKCYKCSKWSWYSVSQIDYILTCNFCLQQFDYPITNPTDNKNSKWAYRVVGPFALPDNAKGGYAAALSLHFFFNIVGGYDEAGITWSTGQELTLGPNKRIEVDFMFWFRRLKKIYGTELSSFGDGLPIFGVDRNTETVFGEAKSYQRFTKKDVDKMKLLAEKFPCSILVFATMNEKLTPSEIKRLQELAEWGRELDPGRRQTRAPVIILTGTELFTTGFLSTAWEEKGGKHKDLSKRVAFSKSNLRIMANFTQHLYLDMDLMPYGPTENQRMKSFNLRMEYLEKNRV